MIAIWHIKILERRMCIQVVKQGKRTHEQYDLNNNVRKTGISASIQMSLIFEDSEYKLLMTYWQKHHSGK